jgi:pSer/pThr/pTyr-binding forkhead associated (FHA) protein/thioredoxin reductase/ferredoxin
MPVETLADGTYVLDEPVFLPEILDVLIVGGGPAGTAAAFRAKELGVTALVVDYDDLMKRIRDYAEDKLILPHFGGGDKMKFPKGGDFVAKLHFTDIDKDDMCAAWKGFYRQCGIPAQIGVELTGLEWQEVDYLWLVRAWNHRTKAEQTYLARHVVLAIGRGVPRRFDIPGNTEGIAYRLEDAARYVGAPTLVIGGGTSAAESVIAISSAKAEAGDACAVYWSYRGDKLPKVSRALSEVFFDAYVGNGNIRYYPRSEPVAVVTGPDRKDYLSVRVDRKNLDGRPCETSHLEFAKEYTLACIGEDIPRAFLHTIGIDMVTGGPKAKQRMVVTPLLESVQPNLYLIGDLLSQAYLETEDFNADPATFREVVHRGNIKTALRDGVFVAEVIKQKLDGRQEISVTLEFEEDAEEAPPEAARKRATDSFLRLIVDREGPPEESIPSERRVQEEKAFLVRMTHAGIDEDEFALVENGVTTLGKGDCTLSFPDDTMLSPNHASVSEGPEGFSLRDDGSDTGTYLRLRPGKPIPLASGDLLRLGRQLLMLNAEKGRFFLLHYDHTGALIQRYALSEKTQVIGRKAPDVTLDARDKILSRRHLAVSVRDGTVYVKDLKSLNGTYLRVRDAIHIEHDDVFRAGQQVFRLVLREERPRDSATMAPYRPDSAALQQPAPKVEAAAPGTQPAVTFEGLGQTFVLRPGQTICDGAEQQGIDLNAECHSGICGSDPIRILSGGEHLNPLGDEEADTLEDICGLEPGPCRLACMVKASGPVVVERAGG